MSLVRTWQHRVVSWHVSVFGPPRQQWTALLLAEEVGELCRATLKREQGIRGSDAKWAEEQKKEAADVFIGLCSFAEACGFDLEAAIGTRWQDIRSRTKVTEQEERLP